MRRAFRGFFPNTGNQGVSGALTVSGGITAGGTILANGAPSLNALGSVLTSSHFSAGGLSGAPVLAAGVGLGTGPPAPAFTGPGTDPAGNVSLGTGTAPAAGALCTVTFNSTYTNPPGLALTPTNAATAALGLFVSSIAGGSFVVSCTGTPAASQPLGTYTFSYSAIGE